MTSLGVHPYGDNDPRSKVLSSLQDIHRTLRELYSGSRKDELTSVPVMDKEFFSKVSYHLSAIERFTGGLSTTPPLKSRAQALEIFDSMARNIRRNWAGHQPDGNQECLEHFIIWVFGQKEPESILYSTHPSSTHSGTYTQVLDISPANRKLLSQLDVRVFIFLSLTYYDPKYYTAHFMREDPDMWYQIKVAKEYLREAKLPSDWIFHEGFQIAIAKCSKLKKFEEFRLKYHRLELDLKVGADTQSVSVEREPVEQRVSDVHNPRNRKRNNEDPAGGSTASASEPRRSSKLTTQSCPDISSSVDHNSRFTDMT